MKYKTSWIIQKDGREDGVHFASNKVVSYTMLNGRDGGASECTLYEFIHKKTQIISIIKSTFGDTLLEEMMEAAKTYRNSEEHLNYLQSNQHLLDFINKLPIVDELKEMLDSKNCDDEGYYCNVKDWCSPDGYRIHSATQLVSDTSSMEYAYSNGGLFYMFGSDKNGSKKCQTSGAIGSLEYGLAYNDFYYCTCGQSFIVLSKTGENICNQEEQKLFGSTIRITRVLRMGNNICFRYDWFSRDYPSGLLRFDIDSGTFNGRCSA